MLVQYLIQIILHPIYLILLLQAHLLVDGYVQVDSTQLVQVPIQGRHLLLFRVLVRS